MNLAEVQFSVPARACLKDRNPSEESLQGNISTYEAERNAAAATFNCRFTAKNARAKLRRLYPHTSALNRCQTPCSPATAWGTVLACVRRFHQVSPERTAIMETYIGKAISDFTLQSSDGRTISLSSLRGQKVLLYFFTSPGGGN